MLFRAAFVGRFHSFLNSRSIFNTEGQNNTFLGTQSGQNNTTGDYNTFLGYKAGILNTTGQANTFLGMQSGFNNTTGNQLEAIGFASVAITGEEGNVVAGLITDDEGVFKFRNLDFGTYGLEISSVGYTKKSLSKISISSENPQFTR